MSALPPWYNSVIEFGYLFHSTMDMLFIVLGLLIVVAVSRTDWKHHLRWASPAAAASILIGFDRLARDLHHYLGMGTRLSVYLTSDLFNYTGNLLSLYSLVMLWRTLRDLTRHPASPDPMTQPPAQPGVWPPAPTLYP